MAKAIISIMCAASDEMWKLMQLTAHNRTEYAIRHGYQLFLRNHLDILHFPEERMTNIVEHLKETDYLLVMGVDTIFTNMTIQIGDIIRKYPNKDIIIAQDINGINNDVMLLRNSDQTNAVFRTIVGRLDEFEQDQMALASLIPMMPDLKVAYPPQKEINAMPYWLYGYGEQKERQWDIGDYIFHCPGVPWQKRIDVMSNILKDYIVEKEEDICQMKAKLKDVKDLEKVNP